MFFDGEVFWGVFGDVFEGSDCSSLGFLGDFRVLVVFISMFFHWGRLNLFGGGGIGHLGFALSTCFSELFDSWMSQKAIQDLLLLTNLIFDPEICHLFPSSRLHHVTRLTYG